MRPKGRGLIWEQQSSQAREEVGVLHELAETISLGAGWRWRQCGMIPSGPHDRVKDSIPIFQGRKRPQINKKPWRLRDQKA